MTTTNDGGPAFPTLPEYSGYDRDSSGPVYPMSTGISVRDWFAGEAIKAAVAAWPEVTAEQFKIISGCTDTGIIFARDFPRFIAGMSGAIADAMLAEREKVKP